MVYRKKGEEPTAKDSMIENQKDRFNQLYELYKNLHTDYKETLREKTSLQLKVSALEGKIEALENVYNEWQKKNDALNKNINFNKTYDGIHKY
tara:strand:+ start:472 stop:750 length:279 start_codon:yes stop_codon:yes gene_type:complete